MLSTKSMKMLKKWSAKGYLALFDNGNVNGDIIPSLKQMRFIKGDAANFDDNHFKPGDFILVHGEGFFQLIIRLGQSLRFWGADSVYTHWHHAALIVDEKGTLIEAKAGDNRVVETNLAAYTNMEYVIVKIDNCCQNEQDREQVVKFANWCKGQQYGFFTIVSIFISLLFGLKFTFTFEGQSICSGLVARALERTRIIFDRSPAHITPADLAKKFDVRPKI